MQENYRIVNNTNYLKRNYLRQGKNGICYKVDNQVYKEFINKPRYMYFLKSLANIKSDYLVFPNEFIYLDSYSIPNLKGYLMDYVEGSRLVDISELINIKEFIIKLDILEKEIKKITEEYSVILSDIHCENILCTPNKLVIIDNDQDTINSVDDVYVNYRTNIYELGNAVLPFILKGGDLISEKVNHLFYLSVVLGKCKPSIVLNEAVNTIEKYKNEEINTLHDLYDGIRLIINK